MSYYFESAVRVACVVCGYTGSPYAVELHSCRVQESGGRCEDYPCCGHVDGDGCQALPEHTSEYWSEAMTSGRSRFLFEPGSPEWYDAAEMDEHYSDDGEEDWYDSQEACEAAGRHGETLSGTDVEGIMTCDACGSDVAVDWSE